MKRKSMSRGMFFLPVKQRDEGETYEEDVYGIRSPRLFQRLGTFEQ